jgi:hypothetical protein
MEVNAYFQALNRVSALPTGWDKCQVYMQLRKRKLPDSARNRVLLFRVYNLSPILVKEPQPLFRICVRLYVAMKLCLLFLSIVFILREL